MARYLIQVAYTQAGVQGVLKEGGTSRRDAIAKIVANSGGTMESFDFAFGDTDAYVLCDVPDNVSAAAVGMAVGASGMASCKTIVLLSPEEIDRAAQLTVSYRAPGS